MAILEGRSQSNPQGILTTYNYFDTKNCACGNACTRAMWSFRRFLFISTHSLTNLSKGMMHLLNVYQVTLRGGSKQPNRKDFLISLFPLSVGRVYMCLSNRGPMYVYFLHRHNVCALIEIEYKVPNQVPNESCRNRCLDSLISVHFSTPSGLTPQPHSQLICICSQASQRSPLVSS